MKRNVITACIILFFSSIIGVILLTYNANRYGEILPASASVVDEKATWQDDLIYLHNVYRAENGLEPLHESEVLNDIAKWKVEDMMENCYWSHYIDNKFVSAEYAKTGIYDYYRFGENLSNALNAQTMFTAWIASPKHRDNMLGDYGEIGVYIYPHEYTCKGDDGKIKFENLTAVIFGIEVE